jgi:hypothetical protein
MLPQVKFKIGLKFLSHFLKAHSTQEIFPRTESFPKISYLKGYGNKNDLAYLKELLKLYMKIVYNFFVPCLVFEIF